MRRHLVHAAVFVALTVASVTTAPAQASGEAPADVIHWYTSAGERAALKVYLDRFEKEGGVWKDEAIAGSAKARAATLTRVMGGNPPTAASYWTKNQFIELLENDLLNDVDAVAQAENWRADLTPAFVDVLTYKGKFIAAPLELFSTNWLWYNVEVLSKAGVEPPKTWDELFVALDKLKAAGVVALSFSEQPANHIRQTVFNSILAGKGGPDLYNAVYVKRDATAINSPAFREVVRLFGRLKSYTDGKSASRQWNDATNAVITGRAAMQLMGDWAKGEFASAGKVPGTDYGCTVLNDTPVMNANVMIFGKTSDAATVRTQRHLASLLMKPDLQVEFAVRKGTIPPRSDADAGKLDACGRLSARLFKDSGKVVWDDNAYTTPQAQGAIQDLLVDYWTRPDTPVDQFVAKFQRAIEQK